MSQEDASSLSDPEFRDARWMQRGSVQLGIIVSVLCTLLYAVPSPTYDVRYVDRPTVVTRTVTRTLRPPAPVQRVVRTITLVQRVPYLMPTTYADAFAYCFKMPGTKTSQCTDYAEKALSTQAEIYSRVNEQCNAYQISGPKSEDPALYTARRDRRLVLCHKLALETLVKPSQPLSADRPRVTVQPAPDSTSERPAGRPH